MDLAVMDGTYMFSDPTSYKVAKTNILIVGRDAVAVEAVSATLAGLA